MGAIAAPLNILGGAINFVLQLLGINCSGPDRSCSKKKQVCTNGAEQLEERDFLDDLLRTIDEDLFPDTSADYNQYVCKEAYEGPRLEPTRVGFRGGVVNTRYGETPTNNQNSSTFKKKIVYSIDDIEVLEGTDAIFTITRSGYVDEASSVSFRTIAGSTATARADSDFIMVDDIVGFAPNETSKTINIRTISDGDDSEEDEIFFARIALNSPDNRSDVATRFEKNVATCTIKSRLRNDPDNYDPYNAFSYSPGGISDAIDSRLRDSLPEDEFIIEDDFDNVGDSTTPRYRVTANRSSVEAGEFIIYTVETRNVANGTVLSYRLSQNFTADAIVGGVTSSTFVINNNQAKLTVGIEDDYESDVDEVLTLSISSTDAFADVLVIFNQDIDEVDIGTGDTIDNVYTGPILTIVNEEDIITDDSGKIIEIPVATPGGPYTEPPFVTIGGNGIGASARALLDDEGFVSEIRVISGGYGYKKNLPENKGVRCIIDTFTLLRPGGGYETAPTIYINDDPTIAEAIINDDGFVVGGRVLNREVTFAEIPKVVIIGGGGYGAKLMPSLVCLPESKLVEIGATKIGTGRYVDCP